jgi:hypothetical protein
MIIRKQMPGKLRQATLWLLLPFFAACGGSSGGLGEAPVIDEQIVFVFSGRFIGSPVQGLSYQCGDLSGTTDANGVFRYYTDETTLTFSVGGVQIASRSGGDFVITPYNFGAAAENIARFLQTLDADGVHITASI